jgi:predicted O-methyltransferase YrrM
MHLRRLSEGWRQVRPMKSLFHKTIETLKQAGPRGTLAKVAGYLRFLGNVGAATVKVKFVSDRHNDLEESIDFAFNFAVGSVSIAPAQIRSEFSTLLKILASDPPGRALEIGTARGGTLFLFSRVARDDAILASIDLPEGAFGGGYRVAQIPLLRTLSRSEQTLKLIRSNSHDRVTLEQTKEWFGHKPIDFLFIDGDHGYEGIRRDFVTYGALVRPNGLIAIHDIVPGRADRVGGVPRFWQDIKPLYETMELVENWQQGGFGIGVVQVGESGLVGPTSIGDPPHPYRLGKPNSLA